MRAVSASLVCVLASSMVVALGCAKRGSDPSKDRVLSEPAEDRDASAPNPTTPASPEGSAPNTPGAHDEGGQPEPTAEPAPAPAPSPKLAQCSETNTMTFADADKEELTLPSPPFDPIHHRARAFKKNWNGGTYDNLVVYLTNYEPPSPHGVRPPTSKDEVGLELQFQMRRQDRPMAEVGSGEYPADSDERDLLVTVHSHKISAMVQAGAVGTAKLTSISKDHVCGSIKYKTEKGMTVEASFATTIKRNWR